MLGLVSVTFKKCLLDARASTVCEAKTETMKILKNSSFLHLRKLFARQKIKPKTTTTKRRECIS